MANYTHLSPDAIRTGARQWAGPAGEPRHLPHYHGFCRSCCHPMHKCCCGLPQCRKVPKELLAQPSAVAAPATPVAPNATAAWGYAWMLSVNGIALDATDLQALMQPYTVDRKDAVIGGGCCVHLSVEYFYSAQPPPPDSKLKIEPVAAVLVLVMDSETTFLSWGKLVSPSGYHIKEGIITTKPGAQLYLYVINAVARVRWCEVFSC